MIGGKGEIRLILSYQDLQVWQKSMDLVVEIYKIVKLLPKEETYALSDQMRRAAVSIPSNIAEGQQRQTTKEFKYFLSIAKSSCSELTTQLLICQRINYLTNSQAQYALSLADEIGRMLTVLSCNLPTANQL